MKNDIKNTKDFILTCGRNLFDFSFYISLTAIIWFASGIENFLKASLIGLIGFVISILLYYAIYIVISINDNLTEIKEILKNKEK